MSVLESVSWVPEGNVFDTQQPFAYRAVIKNHGDKAADNFGVSIYIDDEYRGRQVIPTLAIGASQTLNYYVVPKAGVHKVEIKVDDLNPVLIEENTTNNNMSIITEAFRVVYPEITVGDITWKPTETTLTKGLLLPLMRS
jgi:subtilase family serine protease